MVGVDGSIEMFLAVVATPMNPWHGATKDGSSPFEESAIVPLFGTASWQ